MEKTNLSKIKRASFTIEAAFIVPIAVTVIVLLIGYCYFTHERVRNLAVACRAGIYAAEKHVNKEKPEDVLSRYIEEGKAGNPLGVSWNNFETSIKSTELFIKYSESVLPESFGELYTNESKVKIDILKPVKYKRLEWVAENAI